MEGEKNTAGDRQKQRNVAALKRYLQDKEISVKKQQKRCDVELELEEQ